ncbi:PAS domain-containing sensor histidine kinase [Mucilaginibacter sp.]|jgi:two-component system CheB/CheR fusion protein|uniref:PAS domain-containing sensor histidine kinase n=1 Tax=Mucilaginibacter sp. TaxID=1882438 RepID=UPI002CA83066|nr:ATP-binding protein [Mucilaginibacter sp.]HTI58556.1 ATP-binding protein [Mucilaginibacter sp.]
MADTSTDNLNEGLFQLLFEKSPGSLLVKADAPRFTIAAVSDAYLQITSVQREDVVGNGFFEVFPDTGDDPNDENTARKVFTKVIETGVKIDVPVYRFDIQDTVTKKLSEHYWSCSNIPIHCSEGKVAYILNTVVDITGEVKAKQAAIESENRLLMAADATGIAFWVLDIKTADFSFSPQMVTIFGHQPNAEISLSYIRNQVHPDDMQNIVLTAYNRALVSGQYEYEVRIFWPDESMRWIRTKGMVLFNDKNQPERMLGTIVDVTESKRDEERKNDFIAMASHELKTPLTSLKAYIQLLEVKLSASPDPFVASSLTKALNQVNKMTTLIHGFLDLSKIEPGKLHLKKNIFDINKLVQDVIAENRVIAGTHSLKFTPHCEVKVNADREKIGQVISNYISNAIKYSPKGSTIALTTEIIENHVSVSVADQGIGIKPKDQEKIFQRFYRVEDDDMKHIAGFGIGLYLSSEIIHRHKGQISVQSEEGKGSVFSFTLPLA